MHSDKKIKQMEEKLTQMMRVEYSEIDDTRLETMRRQILARVPEPQPFSLLNWMRPLAVGLVGAALLLGIFFWRQSPVDPSLPDVLTAAYTLAEDSRDVDQLIVLLDTFTQLDTTSKYDNGYDNNELDVEQMAYPDEWEFSLGLMESSYM